MAQNGPTSLEYPWGNDWNAARSNSSESGIGRTTAVGMYPKGTPYDWPVMDLVGTVMEWCMNEYKMPENTKPGGKAFRVLRGGAWHHFPRYCRAANRFNLRPDLRLNFGFRVCRGSPIDPRLTAPRDTETRSR